jgi:site-specific DNA-methyltransferase (adenine-specific)
VLIREICGRNIYFGLRINLSKMKTNHKIICADARSMNFINDEAVHLVITSPPYWQLKDYGDKRQIGYDDSYENYINHLNLVWQESFRVLKPGCRMCINIGDQFARSVYYGRYKVIPIRAEIIKFCETLGLDYMGAIIWQKVTTTNTTGGAVIMGSYPFPRNGILKLDYEFILLFKKQGVSEKITKERKELSKLSPDEWNTFFSGHWKFPGEKQSKHLAIYPAELPNRLIRMFSFVGDTILDPFLGSGTTSVCAKNLDRNSIGIEINREFIPIIKRKFRKYGSKDSSAIELEIETIEPADINFMSKIEALPYIFKDPHRLDKKMDPQKKSFGSRIS